MGVASALLKEITRGVVPVPPVNVPMTDAPYSTLEPLVETARNPLGVPATIDSRSSAVPLAVRAAVSEPPLKLAESTSAMVPAVLTSTGTLNGALLLFSM